MLTHSLFFPEIMGNHCKKIYFIEKKYIKSRKQLQKFNGCFRRRKKQSHLSKHSLNLKSLTYALFWRNRKIIINIMKINMFDFLWDIQTRQTKQTTTIQNYKRGYKMVDINFLINCIKAGSVKIITTNNNKGYVYSTTIDATV